jgi:hypothetical protein
MSNEVWLDPIPPVLHEMARQAIKEGDGIRFLCLASNESGVVLVSNNAELLLERGTYEAALLHAITATRTNNHRIPRSCLKNLFRLADRAKLLAAGDPLPGAGPFTLYRGVAGKPSDRRVRGISWTGTLERALWFANRYPELGNPAVYKAEVEALHVLAYVGSHRGEDEYVVSLPRSVKVERLSRFKNQELDRNCRGLP